MINESLAEKRGLSPGAIATLNALHESMDDLFEEVAKGLKNSTKKDRKDWVDELAAIENKMQEMWGFDIDPNFHSWWYRMPGCLCPVMDNDDRQGTKYHVYTCGCPLHGNCDENR